MINIKHKIDSSRAFQFFQVLRQIAIIVIAIVLARSQLSQAAIGNYEMLFFLLFVLSFFWLSGVFQALLTQYGKLAQQVQQKLLFQLFCFFTAMSLAVVCLLIFGQQWVVPFFTQQTDLDHYALFIVFLFLSLPTQLIEHIYLLQQKTNALLIFAIFSTFGQIAAVVVPLWLGYDFRWSFIGLITFAALKYIWLLQVLLQSATWNIEFAHLGRLLQIAFPLILYAVLGGAVQVVDAYLVNFHYEGDPAQFAIFRYGARELPLTLAVAAAFSSSWLPKLSQQNTYQFDHFLKQTIQLYHLLFPLAIVAALSSRYLFPLVLDEAFLPSYLVFNIYLLILPSRLLFPHTLLIALSRNRLILYVSIAELVVNISISFLLLESYGMIGIAIGTVVAYLFEKFAYLLLLHYLYQIKISDYTAVFWWLLYSFLLLGSVIWSFL